MILEHLFGRLNCKHKVANRKTQPFRTMKYFSFPFQRLVFLLSQPSSPNSSRKVYLYISKNESMASWSVVHPLGNHLFLVVKKALHKGNPFMKPCNFWQNIFTWSRLDFPWSVGFQISSSLQNKEAKTTENSPEAKISLQYGAPRAPSRLENMNSELLMAECPKTSVVFETMNQLGTGGQKLHVWKRLGEKKRPQRCFLQKNILAIDRNRDPTHWEFTDT